jgi:hypothetical protein
MAVVVAEDVAVAMVVAEALVAKAGQMIVHRLANRVRSVRKKVAAEVTVLEEDLRAVAAEVLKEERNINFSIHI